MARSRRHSEHKEVNHERWLITYADLITLLLVFFVVLYAMSKADMEKFRQVSASLSAAFNVDVLTSPLTRSVGQSRLESDPRFTQYLGVRSQLDSLARRLDLEAGSIEVELTYEGIVIHLADAVLFSPGSAQLRPGAARVLDEIAAILGPMPNQVRVEGHTDNVPPPPGSYPDNWELSVLRATNTVRYLTTVGGIAPERLSAVGHGEYRPRADNGTLEGRRTNRRVDFVIVQYGFTGAPTPEAEDEG